jgi:transporter family-2 protein
MSRTVAVLCTLGAGVLAGLQPPANSALSDHVGDLGATFVSLVISLIIITVLLVVAGHPGRLSGLSGIRPEHALGGIAGAAIVSISLIAVKPLGAGAVVALLVAAQVIISVVADRLGWFGLHQVGLGGGRVLGVLLVMAGTVLVTRS